MENILKSIYVCGKKISLNLEDTAKINRQMILHSICFDSDESDLCLKLIYKVYATIFIYENHAI